MTYAFVQMSKKTLRFLMFSVDWCGEFHQGFSGAVLCENGQDKIFSEDQLSEAKAYCDRKTDCVGIVRHPSGDYTPRCGNIIAAVASVSWMSKIYCFKSKTTHQMWMPQLCTFSKNADVIDMQIYTMLFNAIIHLSRFNINFHTHTFIYVLS